MHRDWKFRVCSIPLCILFFHIFVGLSLCRFPFHKVTASGVRVGSGADLLAVHAPVPQPSSCVASSHLGTLNAGVWLARHAVCFLLRHHPRIFWRRGRGGPARPRGAPVSVGGL